MPLDSVFLEGLVVKEQSGFFWVETQGGMVYMCRLRGRLMEEAQSSDIAAIGDRVKISILENDESGDKGVIEAVEERETVLSRAARTEGNRGGGEAEREHVIVANPDAIFFVFAAAEPSPNMRMLDRMLVAGKLTWKTPHILMPASPPMKKWAIPFCEPAQKLKPVWIPSGICSKRSSLHLPGHQVSARPAF